MNVKMKDGKIYIGCYQHYFTTKAWNEICEKFSKTLCRGCLIHKLSDVKLRGEKANMKVMIGVDLLLDENL